MLLVEGKVLNNLETTSLLRKCFCSVLEGRKIKESWFGCFGSWKSGSWAKYGTGGEEGRKHLQTNLLIMKTLFSSEHGLWLSQLESATTVWTCVNHWFNGSNPTWWEIKGRLSDALSYLSILRFSLRLQQGQNFSRKQLCAQFTGFGKSWFFSVFSRLKKDCVLLVICPL